MYKLKDLKSLKILRKTNKHRSNKNINILKKLSEWGSGFDIVSRGELERVLFAGGSPDKIVFSGVGKTSSEISYAIDKKILLINAESKSEIIEIEKIAKSKKKIIDIGISLNLRRRKYFYSFLGQNIAEKEQK